MHLGLNEKKNQAKVESEFKLTANSLEANIVRSNRLPQRLCCRLTYCSWDGQTKPSVFTASLFTGKDTNLWSLWFENNIHADAALCFSCHHYSALVDLALVCASHV